MRNEVSLHKPSKANLLLGCGVVSVLLLVPLLTRDVYWLNLGVSVFVWAAAATAWNISAGFAGGLSLGHAAFFGIGAYSAALLFLKLGITPWVGMLVGSVIAALIGALLGAITFRLRGPFFVLATLAFGIVVHIIVVNWHSLTRGSSGLNLPFDGGAANMLFRDMGTYWYVGLVLLALCLAVSAWIERSRLGYYLVALRENEEAAHSLGVKVVRSKVLAAAVSAGLTALAGSFYAFFIQYIDPSSTTQFELSVQIALIAIVGGVGTTIGPFLGAAIIVPLGEILRAQFGGGPSMVLYGFLLMVIVLAAPNGAIAGLKALRRKFR